MILHAHYVFLLVLYIFPKTPTAAPAAYTATDLILLNCGESKISNDSSNRRWAGDEGSRFMPSNAATLSSTFTTESVFPVPYQTARVFRSPFTYTFPVSPGHKFLRLHFSPNNYHPFNTSTIQFLFSVTANDFTLLTDFGAFSDSQDTLIKEYIVGAGVDVGGNQTSLDLTFSPNSNDSFGFVNGIEIVSMPDALYFRGRAIKYEYGIFELRNDTALENIYRLNVGGRYVDIQDDTGMFRGWFPDDKFRLLDAGGILIEDIGDSTIHLENVRINYTAETPPYTAPPQVYTSTRLPSNLRLSLKWDFSVDSGFMYLLRFHFCEFMPQLVAEPRQRMFSIIIDQYPAESQADVISLAGGTRIPIFRDHMVWVPAAAGDNNNSEKHQLMISLYVEFGTIHESALLNGLEIFKLNNSQGSLAATRSPAMEQVPKTKSRRGVIYVAIGSVTGVFAVVGLLLSFFIFQRRRRQHKVNKYSSYSTCTAAESSWIPLSSTSTSSGTGTGTGTGTGGASQPSKFCRYFSLAQIKTATSDFDRKSIIGRGGFGYVYRGIIVIDNRATTLAIKRLNSSSNQGAREFLTEIEMLSKLRHIHLVSLIGYCDQDGEMILVYEYMAHGSLRDHLYNTENPPLSWKQRLQICMGAAKGLHFLHTGTEHAIIHRDVKSTNILLDDNWEAKVSDFGLSKMGESNDSFTHISTNVKGTFGYLDPKYLSTHQLTRKSDVYAFGVVLFEILTGRPAVDVRLDEEQHSLAGWARFCVREGEVDQLIDPNLVGQIAPPCLQVFVGIAGRSIHIQPLERPTMADVVMGLELALSLQESAYSAQHGEEEEEEEEEEDAGRIKEKAELEEWKNNKAEENSFD